MSGRSSRTASMRYEMALFPFGASGGCLDHRREDGSLCLDHRLPRLQPMSSHAGITKVIYIVRYIKDPVTGEVEIRYERPMTELRVKPCMR